MDQENGSNGSGELRVRFGPAPTQTMPLDWAERVLALMYERRRPQLGQLLAEAALTIGDRK